MVKETDLRPVSLGSTPADIHMIGLGLLFFNATFSINRLHRAIQVQCTPCLKKIMCQLIFCTESVKYEPISIKIGRHVREQTFNKTVHKVPTSPEIRASTTLGNLKCQIELQRNNYMYILMNH